MSLHFLNLALLFMTLRSCTCFWYDECDVIPTEGCTCTHYPDHIQVDCSNLDLTTAPLIEYDGSSEVSLDLSGNNFTSLDVSSFNDIPLMELKLSDNIHSFTIENSHLWSRKAEMLYLILAKNRIRHIPVFIKGASRLLTLDLSYNNILHIEHNDFQGLESLQRLELKGNQIRTIDSYELTDMNLQELSITFDEETSENTHDIRDIIGFENYKDMQKNLHALEISHVRVYNVKFLKKFEHLEHLQMTECGLDDNVLSKHGTLILYKSMEALHHVDLSHNMIDNFPREFLYFCRNLIYLDLSHNNLQHTFFFFTQANSFMKLTYLDLSHNYLSMVRRGMLSPFPAIRHLDLNHNEIITIMEESILAMPDLEFLDLSDNLIVTLDRTMFSNSMMAPLPTDLTIKIRNNPFRCDCNLQWLVDMIGEQASTGVGLIDWYDVYNVECTVKNIYWITMLNVYTDEYYIFDDCDRITVT